MRRALHKFPRFTFGAAILAAGLLLGSVESAHALPIVTDSRIKTFVYNPNEVFNITTHYGYQSNIEFGERETIDTVSVGDRVAWQIIPAGRRIFIRAMEENAHTNMTIVTNLHAYQFDLRSSAADAVFSSEELTYVVRFFYPEDGGTPPLDSVSVPSPAMPVNYSPPPAPAMARPTSTGTVPAPQSQMQPSPAAASSAPVNYHYTYSGPSSAAPVKIYDDGRTTYFKYRSPTAPKIAVITARGEQLDVPARSLPGNVVAVDIVAPRFSLNQPGGQVIVYNESNGA